MFWASLLLLVNAVQDSNTDIRKQRQVIAKYSQNMASLKFASITSPLIATRDIFMREFTHNKIHKFNQKTAKLVREAKRRKCLKFSSKIF